MNKRTRISKPVQTSEQRAREVVRQLYSDLIDNLTNQECDRIIEGQRFGLGPMFITDAIKMIRYSREQNKKRAAQQRVTR